jgi:hypothetical protein
MPARGYARELRRDPDQRTADVRRRRLIFDGSDFSTYILIEPGMSTDEISAALRWG